MSFTIKTTTKVEDAANFIANSLSNQLKLGKHVLFFVTGGSSISVGVKTAELLKEKKIDSLLGNLTVMLTDERYGPLGHSDSNWAKLEKLGFNIQGAKLIPILTGDDRIITTKKFNTILNEEFMIAEYKIGLFGIGADGHTAGILPESVAVKCQELACGYDTPSFSRITMTPLAIEKLDEVVVFAQGEEKWKVIEDLVPTPQWVGIPTESVGKEDILARPQEGAGGDIIKQPAQILKKVPLLTIFTDYKR